MKGDDGCVVCVCVCVGPGDGISDGESLQASSPRHCQPPKLPGALWTGGRWTRVLAREIREGEVGVVLHVFLQALSDR